MLIMVPDFVTDEMILVAREKAMQKLHLPPKTFRFASLHEGRSMQTQFRSLKGNDEPEIFP